jgi:hypothetical protein
MTPQPSTTRSGVAWVVFWVRQVPVCDQHGRQLYQPWNPRARLLQPRLTLIDTVTAPTRDEALTLARERHREDRGNTLTVQSALSYALSLEERAIAKRDRIPPTEKSLTRRRLVHAQEAA